MACLFAGHLAGNCDAAGDTWPVIHSSTASVFSGDPSSLGLARLRHAADLGRRSRLPAPLGAERRIRRGGGTGSSGLNERWTRRGKRRFIAVETLSKSGLSMGVPLVERLTSLSNSLRRCAWAEAQGPGRHSVARRLRAAGRRLVSAPRQCLIEAEFD